MIKICCKGSDVVSFEKLSPLQGGLKVLTDANYEKLKTEILETGFNEPISVWKNRGKNWVLNGHQRLSALKRLSKDGHEIPDIPISLVEAKNKDEAKRKVLALASQYGKVSESGLKDFIADTSLEINDVFDKFEFPEIDKDELLKPVVDAEKDEKEDEVPEVNKVDVRVKPGDIWLLGAYYECDKCGDKFEYEDGKKMNGVCPCG